MKKNVAKITYSALYLCLALVLPFLTGQLKVFGKAINPMHVVVFLCGLTCGAKCGLIGGFIAPLLRSVTFGMPVLYPSAVGMAFELATYGFVSGVIFSIFLGKRGGVYIALLSGMLIGRAVWGIVTLLLWAFMGDQFTFYLFIKGAFIDSVVGIALQLILVPIIVKVLEKANLLLIDKKTTSQKGDSE